jgi:hypothetical protein
MIDQIGMIYESVYLHQNKTDDRTATPFIRSFTLSGLFQGGGCSEISVDGANELKPWKEYGICAISCALSPKS